MSDRIAAALTELDAAHARRRRRVVDSPVGRHVLVDGRPLLAFCSNDYLGLAAHPDLVEALCAGARRWGAGSGASHLVSGHLRPHEELEQKLAAFVGLPRALCFSAGYLANLGVIPALVGRGDAVFSDRLNHASLVDAAVASRAEHKRYAHCDAGALASLLATSKGASKLVATDAVFSMDGDQAPLPRLLELAEAHDAWLMIDDAHGFGVLGENGRGSLSQQRLPPSPRLLYVGTFGKAAGLAGAFVAGSDEAIEWLLQRARTYIFTTAAPPALAIALARSVDLIAAAADRRAHLARLVERLRVGLSQLAAEHGWRLIASSTPIQALIVGDNRAALDLAAALERRGLWLPAIRPPTVPMGSARLRISLSAAHREEDIDALLAALREAA